MECYINGIQYKMLRDFSINDRLANKSSSSIEVLVEDQPIPLAGDIVDIRDSGDRLFFGVAGIPTTPEYNTGNEKKIYKITCQNGNAILANRVTNEAYQNATVSDIVADLYTKYIAEEGILLGWISNIDTELEVYTCVNQNLQSVLNELAGLAGGAWTIDAAKRFYFRSRDDFPKFAYDLDGNLFTSLHRLKESTKSYKLRTVEHIVGATDTTSAQTETFTYTADTDTFTLGFPVASMPTVKVNGVDVTSHVGVAGLDDNNANKWIYFGYNSDVLQYRYSGPTPPLTAGDVLTVTYKGIFNIRVTSRNDAKIAELASRYGTSGLIERLDNSNAKTLNDAKRQADALLLEYSEITHELTFRLTTEDLDTLGLDLWDLDIMHEVTVRLATHFDIAGTYIVTERTLTPDRADMTSPDARHRMLATYVLMDRDYLSGYGTVLSTLQSDVAALSVRAGDTAIQSIDIDEYRDRFEEVGFSDDIPIYPIIAVLVQTQMYMNWPGVHNGTDGLEMYPGI